MVEDPVVEEPAPRISMTQKLREKNILKKALVYDRRLKNRPSKITVYNSIKHS
jgi:hypothetical protein